MREQQLVTLASSRRAALKLMLAGAGAVLLAACGQAPQAAPSSTPAKPPAAPSSAASSPAASSPSVAGPSVSSSAVARPSAQPKSGGNLRTGMRDETT